MTKKKSGANRRKVVFIGASFLFVPTTIRDMLLNGHLEDTDVVLYDIDPDPIAVVLGVTRRMITQRGSQITIQSAKTRAAALRGADYVVTSLLVGGLDVAEKENKLCRKYRICHGVGDTIGPMSIARTIRQANLLVDIARDMEKYCPGAPLLSPTNPMTACTGAVNRYTKVNCIGICHGTNYIREQIAYAHRTKPEQVEINVVGVNHLAFVDQIWIKGEAVDLEKATQKVVRSAGKPHMDPAGISEKGTYSLPLGGRVGFLPNNSDHHTLEFFHWFNGPHAFNAKGKNRYGIDDGLLNIPARRKRRKANRKTYVDWATRKEPIPDMDVFGGDHIDDVILGLEGSQSKMTLTNMHLNVTNGKSVPNLPAEANLELTVKLSKKGAIPVKNPPLEMFRWGVISRLVAINELAMKAAIEKDKRAFMQALHLDPLVADFDTIPELAEGLWSINKPYFKAQK